MPTLSIAEYKYTAATALQFTTALALIAAVRHLKFSLKSVSLHQRANQNQPKSQESVINHSGFGLWTLDQSTERLFP
jgi:hypothetical protein